MTARSYIASLRDPAKREYAERWLAWLIGRGPEPYSMSCSLRAAKAVRITLGSFRLILPLGDV